MAGDSEARENPQSLLLLFIIIIFFSQLIQFLVPLLILRSPAVERRLREKQTENEQEQETGPKQHTNFNTKLK
jgi:inner membrane protein involved in colicin E2 resistance